MSIIRLAAKPPYRRGPLSSNVRPRRIHWLHAVARENKNCYLLWP
jgi:hypothetical protein